MKFKDELYLAVLNIKSSKFRSIIYVLIVTLVLTVLTCVFSGNKTISTFATRYLNADFHYKLIAVKVENSNRETTINRIENLNNSHISKIYNSNYDLFKGISINNEDQNINGYIELYGKYKGINYTIDSGRDIQNRNEIICASNFFPGNYSNIQNDSDMINLKDNLNIEFYGSYEKIKYDKNGKGTAINTFNPTFKVVGTFNVEEDLTGYNICYIAPQDIEEIMKNSEPVYDDIEIKNNKMANLDILVLIDKYENINLVINELNNNNFIVRPYYEMDLSPLLIIEKIIKYLSIALYIASTIIIYSFIKNTFKENEQNIILYKLIGYKNKDVKNIFFLQYC